MNEWIRRFRDQHVLVLGDAILDEYLSGACSRLSPEAPVPVLQVHDTRQVLGGAANAAANVTALGGHAFLVTVLGRDAAGDALRARARAAGIDVAAVSDGRRTPRKTRVLAPRQQLVRLDDEETRPLEAFAQAEVLRLTEAQMAQADILLLSDYAKGFLNATLCQQIIRMAHEHGLDVVVDPRPQHGAFYADADYLTPNWQESQALLGRRSDPPSAGAVRETGFALVQALHANVVLTLGADGIAFFSRDLHDSFTLPTRAREVFDVSGAGDTVVAAFALSRAAGAGHAEALALANRAAGLVVAKFGTATVTPDELLDEAGHDRRLVRRQELAALGATLHARGKRIVSVTGTFDGLDATRLRVLQNARALGDAVFVGLLDEEATRSDPASRRPPAPQTDRADLLLALRLVDYVHIVDDPTPAAFLDELRPDVRLLEQPDVDAGQMAADTTSQRPPLTLAPRSARHEDLPWTDVAVPSRPVQ